MKGNGRDFFNVPVWSELLCQLKHLLLRHVLELAATFGLDLVHVTAHEGGTAFPIHVVSIDRSTGNDRR